jgi:hypothetical protein
LTSIAERVPLDRIGQRARQAHPGRAVLVVVASLLLAMGWAAFKLCAAAWLVLAWCGSAVIEGWQSAKTGQRAP